MTDSKRWREVLNEIRKAKLSDEHICPNNEWMENAARIARAVSLWREHMGDDATGAPLLDTILAGKGPGG